MSQQSRIDSLWRFVQEQRAARRKVQPVVLLLLKSCASNLLTSLQWEESYSGREGRVTVENLTDEGWPRPQGPSAREARRDTTAFEAARAEWGKAELSIKGGVGAEGDHRTELWLG